MIPQSKRPQPRSRGGPQSVLRWALPAAGLVIAAIVVLAALGKARPPQTAATPGAASVVTKLISVTPKALASFGVQGATPPYVVKATSLAHNTVLYIGSEYCPYCAAERWPLVLALSHFGHLKGLHLIHSSTTDVYPGTPTLSFYGSTYQSAAIRLETVELNRNVANSSGVYPTLQTPTAVQQALIQKFDVPPYVPASDVGAIPFLLIGGKYMWIGTGYDPALLKNHSWQQIAQVVANGKGSLAQAVISNANAITGAICSISGVHSAPICSTPAIRTIISELPK